MRRLDRRRFLRTVAATGAVAAAGACAPAPRGAAAAPGATGTVRIGFVSPETGALAAFGETDQYVAAAFEEHVARHPLQIGGRAHGVEVLKRDSQSDPDRAADVAADLILNDRVHLVLVSSTPDTTDPVSDQCEAAGVPCVATATAWQPWSSGRSGLAWSYLFSWGLDDVEAVYAAMWDQVATNRTAGALWPDDPDGLAWANPDTGVLAGLAARGYSVVDPGNHAAGTQEFSTLIAALRAADADVLFGVPAPADFAAFWRQAADQGYRPRIATLGKALVSPADVEALGPLGANLATEVWWSPAHPFTSSLTGQSAAALAEAYTAATGRRWSQPLGPAHALFEVAAAALSAVGAVEDRRGIADAIGRLRLDTVVGPLDFTAGPVPNVATTPLVGGQWRAGPAGVELVVVSNTGHPEIPVAGAVEPLPPA
ncbi:ABC transporter substrate-binding protein [Pseudonocardia kunmingensis]|uniref:Amino acid/amide ABC transporter substrate-binding protein (HAAT family) n=1 Tax=Pseudonocardia kunmingensis TaxID=630975 RepID=A0A543D3M0_9PSEU|nr:ABC transporter substrate-binding protein [Pseudonocardia kunmingensis]TQM03934.1 amino acid/amide ABC transporter substrate-binding protein (HAAT family) [Pseudonocardia kunmingensis]